MYPPLVDLVADTSSGNSWEIIEGSARENRAWDRERERERNGEREKERSGRSEVVHSESRARKLYIECLPVYSNHERAKNDGALSSDRISSMNLE